MRFLYITYIDFGDMSSGSNVRPQMMYNALLQRGHTVQLVETQQNKLWKRTKAVWKALRWIKNEKTDACYVELPSGPIFNPLDIVLLIKVAHKGIPIHVFYRDAYWLLAKDLLPGSRFKNKVIEWMQKRDLRVFKKTVGLFYMPSQLSIERFSEFYRFGWIKPLPPGTENNIQPGTKTTYTGIYVGGASKAYGVDNLIEAYSRLNKDKVQYKLIIVTRNGELADEKDYSAKYSWLSIYHVSGKQNLEPLYRQADCAFLPQRKSSYLDMSFGVKMFEYIGYGLPIIVNNLYEMKKFVEAWKIGLSYDETVESLMRTIQKFYSGKRVDTYRENVIKACKSNLWESRVDQVVADFNKNRTNTEER